MKPCLLIFFLLASLAGKQTLGQPLETGSKPPFANRDVFELEWISDPQISPDGRRVVFVRNAMDIMQDDRQARLWIANTDGTQLMKLTHRDVNESSPRWSPDGTRIAFISKAAGEHGKEIFLHWVASDKTSRLTQLERSPTGLNWSPDGRLLAFSMLAPDEPPVLVKSPVKPKDAQWAEAPRVTTRLKYEADGSGRLETGFNHFFVIPAEGGTARQITRGEYHHKGTPQWSADGKHLLFSANRNADWEYDYRNSEIYRVPLDGGKTVALTDRKGPDNTPRVSPDGRKIAYLGYDDQVQAYQVNNIYLMDADGSNKREIPTKLDRSVSGLAWDRNGKGLYFQYDDKGDTKIGYTSLAGKHRVVAGNLGGTSIGRPYGGGSFSVSDAGGIAYTYTTPYHPAELAVVGKGNRKPRLITSFNADLLPNRTLGEVSELWYKSSIDDRDIQGWIVTPPNYDPGRRYPLLVENHGGPIANYGERFSPEVQLFAAAGYVVFYPNPRGSTGYGEEFGNLLYNNYPGDDYQDVMDGVDVLIERKVTAADRLFVTGGSAGGIMTAWIIGKNNRFQAAAVVKPVMNWFSKTLTADNYYAYADYRYPGQPWEDIQNYMKFSPISLVGNIETPTVVMVGTDDLRTPLSEAKQLYHALKLRKIDTALVEVPGASHFIAKRPSQLVTKVDHILAWFAKYRSD
ncbi:S9 family peptidase [Exilibacterium tricleocarpae]|uniref:S9 family peptidase n=1 Tax=Exilibacterium tricleocarpae TaxID=2591008 RepID=A0A545T1S1_9GAMM|nr:S9 family peptidase [Exilibacterium tricleocarpae]TQV71142.1 S9 family peptidase [Exilibacterium tricleocarpae]